MTRVAGLDLSIARTGIAVLDGGLIQSRSVTTRIRPDQIGRRLVDLEHLIWSGLDGGDVDVVVMEGYSLKSPGLGGLLRRAELVGCVLSALARNQIPVVDVAPMTLKRYATGSGDADKQLVTACARAAGARPANDDEADAFWLAALGRHHYDGVDPIGLDGTTYRDQLVRAITWPVLR